MSDIYSQLKNKTRTDSRADLPDVYQRARDLEVQQLAEKLISQAGRSASPEFLTEVAQAIVVAAQKRGNR